MTYYYRLSLATKEARRLHGVTGLDYHVVTYDGEKWVCCPRHTARYGSLENHY